MKVFPAIDIRNGKCVRLVQGDYAQEIIYGDSPVDMAKYWEKEQAEYLHVVDLDGAKSGASKNRLAIEKIVEAVSIPVQVGGGIRSMNCIDDYIEKGVARVIIGTAAITNLDFVKEAVERYGDQIAVSIDARKGYVATEGWTETTSIRAIELLGKLEEIGVKTIVYTDIAKDGMLAGPNMEELRMVQEATKIDVIASGGITTAENVRELTEMNVYGAIIGKALYESKISLQSLRQKAQVRANRIIPCLDIDEGKVVKGKQFKNIQAIADPLLLAKKYVASGADELVLYDITASLEKHEILIDLIESLAREVSIPLTVGGGICTLGDIEKVFKAGADKVSLNSIILEKPQFLKEAAARFGSHKIVLSMDVQEVATGSWQVFAKGGRVNTRLDAIDWAKQCASNGAGEIVLNSIDGDGEKSGYQLRLTKAVSEAVQIPVIASGGAGEMKHFRDAFLIGKADGALAASVFHYDEIDIGQLKQDLQAAE